MDSTRSHGYGRSRWQPDQMGRTSAIAGAKSSHGHARVRHVHNLGVEGALGQVGARGQVSFNVDKSYVGQQPVNMPVLGPSSLEIATDPRPDASPGASGVAVASRGKHDLAEATDADGQIVGQVHP